MTRIVVGEGSCGLAAGAAAVYDALEARELIKGCVQQGAPLDAKSALTILCEKTGAEPIQFIGRRFVMFRPSRENPRITIE